MEPNGVDFYDSPVEKENTDESYDHDHYDPW